MRHFGLTSSSRVSGDRPARTEPDGKRCSSKVLMGLGGQVWKSLLGAIGAPLLAGLLLVPQAWLLADVIDRALVGRVGTGMLVWPIAGIAALIAARAGLVFLGETFGSHAAQAVMEALRAGLFRHMLAQRPDWTAARASGELSGAIADQVGNLEGFFSRYLPSMVLATFLPVWFAIVALWADPAVGLLFLVTAPLIPVFMALVGWGAQAAHERHQLAFRRLSGFFADRLRGMLTLRLLGRTGDEADRLRLAGNDLRARTLGVLRITFLSSAVLEFFAALGVAGVALYVGLTYLGFLHLHAGPMSLKTGLFCLLLAPDVYLPLRQFAAHYHDRAGALAAIDGIQDLFGQIPESDAKQDVAPPSRIGHGRAWPVLVSGLTVRTPDGRSVLDGAEMAVVPGSHVAILGASGIGKSTLVEAIAGLRDHAGDISLDGIALEDMPENILRERVAVLGQRPRLFHGTLADNIRFGRNGATDAEVAAAADRAGVSLFAAFLPEGLASMVGEGGQGISGGEAHRVALARIYLRDPAVVLLDEPTAHLDRGTEAHVLDGLMAFAAGRTLLVATHSARLAERMDRVLRIERGKILSTPHRRAHRNINLQKGVA